MSYGAVMHSLEVGKMRLGEADIKATKLIGKVRHDPEVLAVIVFGSRARGDGREDSDLAVCLVLQPKDYSELELTHKRLEYLGLFGSPDLDIQVYQQLPLYIRRRVLKEGEILLCRDQERLYELAFRTVQEFKDFKHIYEGYLEEVARG